MVAVGPTLSSATVQVLPEMVRFATDALASSDRPDQVITVFLAKVPGGESGCFVQWIEQEKMFVDFCDPQNQFPPSGFGLEELNWKVIENELRIEINDLSDADLND